MADFILNMPLRLFARVFGNPAGDPVLLKSRGVTLLRDTLNSVYPRCELVNYYKLKYAFKKLIETHLKEWSLPVQNSCFVYQHCFKAAKLSTTLDDLTDR